MPRISKVTTPTGRTDAQTDETESIITLYSRVIIHYNLCFLQIVSDILTNADVDGALSDASLEEATAAVTTDSSVVFSVAAVTTHGAHCCL